MKAYLVLITSLFFLSITDALGAGSDFSFKVSSSGMTITIAVADNSLVPTQQYHNVGIKILTPGYKFDSNNAGCSLNETTGFCRLDVSQHPGEVRIVGPSGQIQIGLTLFGKTSNPNELLWEHTLEVKNIPLQFTAVGYNYTEAKSLIAQSLDKIYAWKVKTSGILKTDPTTYTSLSCLNNNEIVRCVAVGDNAAPIIMSDNNGDTWGKISLSESGMKLRSVSCAAQTCSAVGERGGQPFIVQTSNEGSSWSIVDVPDLPEGGYLTRVHCTPSVKGARCISVGHLKRVISKDSQSHDPIPKYSQVLERPFLVQSSSDGSRWEVKAISGTGLLKSVSCDSNTENKRCVAVGWSIYEDQPSLRTPLIVTRADDGNSWSVKGGDMRDNGALLDVSCISSSSDDIKHRCFAVGVSGGENHPSIRQSIDGGNTWAPVSIKGLPETFSGSFNKISCTSVNDSIHCVAVGYGKDTPILAQYKSATQTWQVVNLDKILESGYLYSVNCVSAESVSSCLVGGAGQKSAKLPKLTGHFPVILQTTDSGENWDILNLESLPERGAFFDVNAVYKAKKP